MKQLFYLQLSNTRIYFKQSQNRKILIKTVLGSYVFISKNCWKIIQRMRKSDKQFWKSKKSKKKFLKLISIFLTRENIS